MGFSRYLKLILKRFWIVILLEVVTIASTFFYTQSQPVSYTTRATIILNPRVPNSLVPYIDGEATYASGLAENYNLIIKSDKFTRKVQQLLDFPISLEALSNSYSARLAPNSVFYYISATFNSPEKAQKIANAVTKLFLSEGLNQTNPANAKPEDIVDVTVKKQRQELEYVQGQIDSIKAQIVVLQQITPTLNTIENLKQLNQELKDNLDIQSRIVLSITEVEGKNTADKQDSATLIDDAKLPLSPNSNNLMRNLLFAIVLALVLGVGLIVSLDYLDYTVRSSEELAQLTGYSTLGVVPIIRGSNNSGDAASFAADSASGELAKPSAQLITANEFRSAGSEAYRVLRTNILFSALANNSGQNQLVARSAENDSQPPGEPLLKTFLITSAIPKEGKSQTAANLAVVFAQTGSKVILVDTDLRKPTLHTYFGLPNEEGFSNLILSGPSDADTFLKKTTIPNLTLITAGTPPPNPSELLTSVKAALVIKALSDMSDIIIFDSPPAVLVSDAAILANRVDQVLLVFRSGSTRRAAISKAVTNLKKVGATVIGTVLNRVDEKDDGGYYYYGGYDYYAGSKKKNQKLKKAAKKG